MKYVSLIVCSMLAMLVVPGCLRSESTSGEGDEAIEVDVEPQAECKSTTLTVSYSGTCGVCTKTGGGNGLYHNKKERECCGTSCTPWRYYTVCGNCAG
jgi:hypothetical protein